MMLVFYLLVIGFEYVVAWDINGEITECSIRVLSCNEHKRPLTSSIALYFYEEEEHLRMICQGLLRYRMCLNSDKVYNKCSTMEKVNAFTTRIIETSHFAERVCEDESFSQEVYLFHAPCFNYFLPSLKQYCKNKREIDFENKLNNLDTLCRERRHLRNCEMKELEMCGTGASKLYDNVMKFNNQMDFFCDIISPDSFVVVNDSAREEFRKQLQTNRDLNAKYIENMLKSDQGEGYFRHKVEKNHEPDVRRHEVVFDDSKKPQSAKKRKIVNVSFTSNREAEDLETVYDTDERDLHEDFVNYRSLEHRRIVPMDAIETAITDLESQFLKEKNREDIYTQSEMEFADHMAHQREPDDTPTKQASQDSTDATIQQTVEINYSTQSTNQNSDAAHIDEHQFLKEKNRENIYTESKMELADYIAHQREPDDTYTKQASQDSTDDTIQHTVEINYSTQSTNQNSDVTHIDEPYSLKSEEDQTALKTKLIKLILDEFFIEPARVDQRVGSMRHLFDTDIKNLEDSENVQVEDTHRKGSYIEKGPSNEHEEYVRELVARYNSLFSQLPIKKASKALKNTILLVPIKKKMTFYIGEGGEVFSEEGRSLIGGTKRMRRERKWLDEEKSRILEEMSRQNKKMDKRLDAILYMLQRTSLQTLKAHSMVPLFNKNGLKPFYEPAEGFLKGPGIFPITTKYKVTAYEGIDNIIYMRNGMTMFAACMEAEYKEQADKRVMDGIKLKLDSVASGGSKASEEKSHNNTSIPSQKISNELLEVLETFEPTLPVSIKTEVTFYIDEDDEVFLEDGRTITGGKELSLKERQGQEKEILNLLQNKVLDQDLSNMVLHDFQQNKRQMLESHSRITNINKNALKPFYEPADGNLLGSGINSIAMKYKVIAYLGVDDVVYLRNGVPVYAAYMEAQAKEQTAKKVTDEIFKPELELPSSGNSNSKISEAKSDGCDKSPYMKYTADLNTDERFEQLSDEIRRRGEAVKYCAEKNKKSSKNDLKNLIKRDICEEILKGLMRLEKNQKGFFKIIKETIESYLEIVIGITEQHKIQEQLQ